MNTKSKDRVVQMEDASGFPVAVKRRELNEANVRLAGRERKMLEKFKGKGIPAFLREFRDADHIFLVTEWINGTTLKKYVEESGGFLPADAAVEIAEKILAPIKFVQVSGDEPNQPRKPDPTRPLAVMKSCGVKPEDVAYFGDTAVDIETAHNAGFLSVGVTWGFRPRSELVESGAEIIVDSPQEILARINFG